MMTALHSIEVWLVALAITVTVLAGFGMAGIAPVQREDFHAALPTRRSFGGLRATTPMTKQV